MGTPGLVEKASSVPGAGTCCIGCRTEDKILTCPFAIDLEELCPALGVFTDDAKVDGRELDAHVEQGLAVRQRHS